MAVPKSSPVLSSLSNGRVLQRKCACGGIAGPTGECEECKKKKKLQRRAANTHSVSSVPSIVHDVLSSPGRPLDAGTRGFMEPRFGHDFSHVRVHDDARAAESARAVDAHAYTVGDDIVFNTGRYDSGSGPGRQLLAHELAHTIQQRGLQCSSAGVSLPSASEDQRLEREAQRVAVTALSGGGLKTDAVTVNGSAVLSRAKAPPGGDDFKPLQTPVEADTLDHVVFEVEEPFPLPKEKGPVKKFWNNIAKGGGLRASLDLRTSPKVDIKQDRPELRDTWLAKVGWASAERDKRWSEVAALILTKKPPEGKDLVEEFPKVDGVACHMDHIVELQVFGGNEKENIQVLDPRPNMTSGGLIRGYLTDKGELVKAKVKKDASRLGAKPPAGVLLIWRSVTQDGELCGPCCEIEKAAVKGSSAKKGSSVAAQSGVTSEGLAVTPKKVSFLGKKSEILINKNEKKAAIPLRESEIVENRAVSRLIPGVSLVDYNIKKPAISAAFDPDGVRLPLSLKEKAGKQGQIHVAVGKDGELSVQSGKTHIPIHYLPLSDGFIEHVTQESGALAGNGYITPSIPLLKGVVLGIEFSADHLAVTTQVPKEQLKSLPGMRVTEASLKFELAPNFKPSGTIGFEIGPQQKPVATGGIKVSADEQGFLAQGDLIAHIPGLDEAKGNVTYRRETGWAGGFDITKSSKDFIQTAAVHVGFSDKDGLDLTGNLGVKLPGDQKITVTVHKKGSSWVFIGDGEFKTPGELLDPVLIHFTYDGEKLEGSGETGVKFRGLNGQLKVKYLDGKVSGEGTLKVNKGRASGTIHLKMSPAQKFSAEGEVTIKVTENLTATAGIKIDENEKVTLKGALEFPKPIELFKPFQGDYKIFSIGVSIPIPGASIGPIGVKARIEGGLSAGYHIGPGELRNVKVTTVFNPLEDKPDFDLIMQGQLYIAAGAHISGSISGSIVLDVGIASASGGLTVTATALLDGHVASQVELHYMKGRFDVKADLDLLLGLALKLALDAFVNAEAGIGPFKVGTRKDWNLASYSYDTGLKLGMKTKTPLYYASDQPFKPPSLDQIEITKPNIDVSKVLADVFQSAGGKEKAK
jgi:Domain of unknown function (DUF4157)